MDGLARILNQCISLLCFLVHLLLKGIILQKKFFFSYLGAYLQIVLPVS